MVHDVPLIGSRHLDDRVVGRAIDFALRILLQHHRLVGHLDWAERRGRCAVGHVVVGRSRVVDRPHEIVQSVAVEHVGRLTVGVVAERSTLRCHERDGLLLDAGHVGVELGSRHHAVAPVEVRLLAHGVYKHVDVDELSVESLRLLADERMAEVDKRASGRVGHGHTHLLASAILGLRAVVEEVFVALGGLHLLGSGCPEVAVGPGYLSILGVEHHTLAAPFLQVGRRVGVVFPSSPTRLSVGGGVDIIALGLVGIENLRVGVEPIENGVALCAHTLGSGRNGPDGSVGAVSHGLDDDAAAVAGAIGQRTVVGEEEPLVAEVDNGRMGGVAVAGNLRDDAHRLPRALHAVGHGIGYLLRPFGCVGEVILAVVLMHPRRLCERMVGAEVDLLDASRHNLGHVVLQFGDVTLAVAPDEVGRAVVVDVDRRVDAGP